MRNKQLRTYEWIKNNIKYGYELETEIKPKTLNEREKRKIHHYETEITKLNKAYDKNIETRRELEKKSSNIIRSISRYNYLWNTANTLDKRKEYDNKREYKDFERQNLNNRITALITMSRQINADKKNYEKLINNLKGTSQEALKNRLTELIQPQTHTHKIYSDNNYDSTIINENLVTKIISDGSLDNGKEIIVCGNNQNTKNYLYLLKNLERKLYKITNLNTIENSSQHITYIIPNYNYALERTNNNNLIMLWLNYESVIYWISSATYNKERKHQIIRYKTSKYAEPLSQNLCYSCVVRDNQTIITPFNGLNHTEYAQFYENRYKGLNLTAHHKHHFRIEIRTPDRHFIPTLNITQAEIFKNLILTSYKLRDNHVFLKDYPNKKLLRTNAELTQKIISHRKLSTKNVSTIRTLGNDLINLITPTIHDTNPKYAEVIIKMAKKIIEYPISLRLRTQTHKEIEKEFYKIFRQHTHTQEKHARKQALNEMNNTLIKNYGISKQKRKQKPTLKREKNKVGVVA